MIDKLLSAARRMGLPAWRSSTVRLPPLGTVVDLGNGVLAHGQRHAAALAMFGKHIDELAAISPKAADIGRRMAADALAMHHAHVADLSASLQHPAAFVSDQQARAAAERQPVRGQAARYGNSPHIVDDDGSNDAAPAGATLSQRLYRRSSPSAKVAAPPTAPGRAARLYRGA